MGGDCPTRLMKQDEQIAERLPLRGTRQYKIPLPSRPTAITITIGKLTGIAPLLWGSTSCERPSAKSHSLRGKDQKLVYEHAILHAIEDDEDMANFDRRHAVPHCRELFVTAEADKGECSYELSVSFSHMKIVLSRDE